MKPGLPRFNYFLGQVQPILTTAGKQKNPALWLYRNDARTPLFMLEGLAKIYAELHNKKLFTKVKEHFKLLEDALGGIEFYDSMAKDFVTNKKIPALVITYLQAQSREKIQSLNEILAENNWLSYEDNRIVKIQKKLGKADWKSEEQEAGLMKDFYGEAVYNIVEFVQGKNFQFTNMESEVHELRRKVRWLSIYPQAVRGAIQLKETIPRPRHLAKYCLKEITTSPFNKMADANGWNYLLFLEKNYFYALSWMIAELGILKDSGLRIVALQEALEQTSSATNENALKEAYRMLGHKQPKMLELLDTAGDICKIYFKEQNLEHLVIEISPTKK
ncbi:MAG: hypothetical protein WKI04_03300 [Ferruginibacter sp.]